MSIQQPHVSERIVAAATKDQVYGISRNLRRLPLDISRHASVNSQEPRFPTVRQTLPQLFDDIRRAHDISCVVKNGIAEQNNMVHGS